MHNRGYYRNSNGDFDPHAMKIAGKNRDAYKNDMRKLNAVTDGSINYSYYKTAVESTLGVSVEGLNTNRKNTQLALRNNLSLVPINVGRELREGNFSMMPIKDKPAPEEPDHIILAA